MAPSALSGEAIALVKDSGLSILKALRDSARANPVPALLIGAGLTMLLTRTTGGDVMGVATSTLRSELIQGVGAAPQPIEKGPTRCPGGSPSCCLRLMQPNRDGCARVRSRSACRAVL